MRDSTGQSGNSRQLQGSRRLPASPGLPGHCLCAGPLLASSFPPGPVLSSFSSVSSPATGHPHCSVGARGCSWQGRGAPWAQPLQRGSGASTLPPGHWRATSELALRVKLSACRSDWTSRLETLPRCQGPAEQRAGIRHGREDREGTGCMGVHRPSSVHFLLDAALCSPSTNSNEILF